jgi:hypothetical protein
MFLLAVVAWAFGCPALDAGAAPARLLPQLGQKLAPAVVWLPQPGQNWALATGVPQLLQNLSPDWIVLPHFVQFIFCLAISVKLFTGF